MHLYSTLLLLALLIGFSACRDNSASADTNTDAMADSTLASTPDWAKSAVWYQIFVERFRNGDPNNDPTPADMAGAVSDTIPPDWAVTPWGHDWYAPDPWMKSVKGGDFYRAIQLRRYGGDLQGVLDRLDYLADLGINAIYFNPLNDAPSLHKYDARHYHHIDRNFGPDPRGDAALMAAENHDDPGAWRWTAADSLFLQVIREAHQRGIRVILDYSWNHTGNTFWALNDLREKQEQSKYKDWFHVMRYDDPATPENEFEYEGWFGIKSLPVLKEDVQPYKSGTYAEDDIKPVEGNMVSPTLREHIFAVSRRWLDPNGDGDPSDGVDGFRLDVAAEVTMGFWRDYRRFVRSINPEAYLVGEVWYQKWPYQLLDPQPYLQGDMFDAVMNYRWYRLARGLFAQAGPVQTPSSFVAGWDSLLVGYDRDFALAMMNVAASHDTPRLGTSFFNKNYYKYNAKPNDNPDYKVHRPDEATRRQQRLFLVHHFTFVGAPHIWNGDELGMWGSDDPDCRKPLVWPDLSFANETAFPLAGRQKPVDRVYADTALTRFYTQLAHLRRDHPVLHDGQLDFTLADDAKQVLAYSRWNEEGQEVVTVFNLSAQPQQLSVPTKTEGPFRSYWSPQSTVAYQDKAITMNIPAMEAVVFVTE